MEDTTTLYFREGPSDKVYQACIRSKDNGFMVHFAYGRRGSTLNTGIKTQAPVEYQIAKGIYDKLIKDKMSKGYLPGTDSPHQAPVEGPKKHSGIQCQLLNPIEEKQAKHLLTNPDYWMQEKMDGRRLIIRKEGDTITGINRLGFMTSVPEMIARSAAKHQGNFILDGEAVPPELRRSIHEAMECASVDATRYVLNGTFIDASNPKANYIVGTDGKHLYSANSFTLPLKNSVIIPNHKFLGWKEFNADGEWQMKVDDKAVQLSSRRWRFISKQIEGNYPNWRQTIPNPNDAKTHITLDPAKLETLIKLIQRMPCHDPDKFQTIGLEIKMGQFLLLGKDHDNEPWTRVPVSDAKAEGPEMITFLSRRFLIKALEYGLNTISLMDQMAPLRFHDKGRKMIVMPLRPQGDEPQPPANQQPAPVIMPPSRPAPPPTPPPQQRPMITNPTSEGPAPNESKSATEEAIDMTLIIRDKLNEGFNMLRDLSMKLKVINRDQKTSARKFNSVRSTLRSIQGLKL